MAAAAEPEGLAPLLARILRNIGDAESQRQLGHALGVGPAQISSHERPLSQADQREADPEDHRLRRPQLTAKGRAAVARIEARTAASSPVAQAFDEKQMRTLLRTLGAHRPPRPVTSPGEGE